MQAMENATGSLWAKGALRNKPAGLFTSTATQGGGQEATCMSGRPPYRSLHVVAVRNSAQGHRVGACEEVACLTGMPSFSQG